jgi:hypothetical protein
VKTRYPDLMRTILGREMICHAPAADGAAGGRADAGEYRLLYKYLRDRYADRVVLTFSQIEDLIGFPLPESARFQPAWWDSDAHGSTPRSVQADSWTLAGRTATVNLSARSVVFERDTL